MIGIYDADNTGFPNLALMKISAYYKSNNIPVEWANPLFGKYAKVYISKVFSFTESPDYIFNAGDIIYGGTGYNYNTLPQEIDKMQPDYSIYKYIDNKTAYGFLTRGCPNKCKWCIVPHKEGQIKPYMDIEEIATDGRRKIILMDNNILASNYGLEQLNKIIKLGLYVDFNQGLDARLVTDDIAQILARVNFIRYIRFGCDTEQQIIECENAIAKIDQYKSKKSNYFLYTMLNDDIKECCKRINYFRRNRNVTIFAQPFLKPGCKKRFDVPQWQKDLARYCNVKSIYRTIELKDYQPRLNVRFKDYL